MLQPRATPVMAIRPRITTANSNAHPSERGTASTSWLLLGKPDRIDHIRVSYLGLAGGPRNPAEPATG